MSSGTNRGLVAGVDSSTQSCKVVLRRLADGVVVGSGSAPHPPAAPPRSEQPPDQWWTAFVAAFQRAGDQAAELRAISVAAQCHGLVVLDDHDQVIRPAKLWNDTTSTPELVALRERIGDQDLIQRVGSLPTAAFTLSKAERPGPGRCRWWRSTRHRPPEVVGPTLCAYLDGGTYAEPAGSQRHAEWHHHRHHPRAMGAGHHRGGRTTRHRP